MKLPELQRLCAAEFTAQAGNAAVQNLSSHIRQSSVGNANRIAVYQNNVVEIARGALANVYPTIEQLVGAACFRSLARAYLDANPSQSGDLQSYGCEFPALLDELYGATEHAFLGDIARLEFALDESLTQPYRQGISGRQLQNAASSEADSYFTANPSFFLVESKYPILTLWRAHHRSTPTELSLDADGQNVALVRLEDEAQMISISDSGARLIRALAAGNSLGDAVGETNSEELVQTLQEVVISAAFMKITPQPG